MYVYPGDSSPTTREGAWQIVMSVHSRYQNQLGNDARQSNSSDPASDTSQLEEDVFAPAAAGDEVAPNTQTAPSAATATAPLAPSDINSCLPPTPPPAPPAYSESGIRYQQQLSANSFDGILPATRARLASLKSLGSKKLQAIKMRLSDQRQKIDECM